MHTAELHMDLDISFGSTHGFHHSRLHSPIEYLFSFFVIRRHHRIINIPYIRYTILYHILASTHSVHFLNYTAPIHINTFRDKRLVTSLPYGDSVPDHERTLSSKRPQSIQIFI